MKAKFTGWCKGAGHEVRVGDEIVPDRGGWSHPAHRRTERAELATVREARLSGPAPYDVLLERAIARQHRMIDANPVCKSRVYFLNNGELCPLPVYKDGECETHYWKTQEAEAEAAQERAAYDAEMRRDEQEYQQGLADGRRYQAEKRVYGPALAERFAAQDEFTRYWKYGEE